MSEPKVVLIVGDMMERALLLSLAAQHESQILQLAATPAEMFADAFIGKAASIKQAQEEMEAFAKKLEPLKRRKRLRRRGESIPDMMKRLGLTASGSSATL